MAANDIFHVNNSDKASVLNSFKKVKEKIKSYSLYNTEYIKHIFNLHIIYLIFLFDFSIEIKIEKNNRMIPNNYAP